MSGANQTSPSTVGAYTHNSLNFQVLIFLATVDSQGRERPKLMLYNQMIMCYVTFVKVLLAYWNKPKVGIKLHTLSNSILNATLVSFLFIAVVNPYFSFQFNFFDILVEYLA